MNNIPFGKAFIAGKELYYIAQAVLSGSTAGNGPFTKKCNAWLEEQLGAQRTMLTQSCTAALEIAAILLDIQPGDEIIMPSFTFVSTANAFVLRGGVPVFVDIRPDTLNIDERLIEAAITPKTKAIVPVHYAGVPCAMDQIMAIADRYGLFVVEDAAQSLLSKYHDKYLGTIGHFGTLSFHETKNIISGEGGALMINDKRFVERAEIVWEKGTDRSKFFRGEVDKYTWVDIGSSYLPSELISAFLFAQLENAQAINARRVRTWQHYFSALMPLAESGLVTLPQAPDAGTCNGHLFYLLTNNLAERTSLIRHLGQHNIGAVFHYVPLHSSPAGKRYGRAVGKLQITDNTSDRLLRLPLFFQMTDDEVERVVDAVYEFYKCKR